MMWYWRHSNANRLHCTFVFAVVRDDMITFGYDKGMEIRDLRLNTKLINDLLQVRVAYQMQM